MPRKSAMSYETQGDTFAKQLTAIMKERGETQTSIAAKITDMGLPIQRQTISLYMNGQSKPDTDRLAMLAKALNVSSDWLLGLSTVSSPDTNIRAVCNMTGIDQEIVKHLVEWHSKEYSDDEVDPILEFNTLFCNPAKLWNLLLCVYNHSINIDLLCYLRSKIADEQQHFYSEDKGWERPQYAKDLLEEVLELEKEIRYARFDAIDTFTSIFDGVQGTKNLEHEVSDLLDKFYGLELDDSEEI